MNIGIIGTGNRATAYYDIEKYDKSAKIIALCDIDNLKINRVINKYFSDNKKIRIYNDYIDLINDNDIDSVIICTPDFTHPQIIIDAIKKNKKILLEKPVATNMEDLELLYKECNDYELTILPSFVLRYTNIFKKVNELIKNNTIGDIITIEANETLKAIHAASFFRRWHKDSINNGGFLNAKCSHDIDLLNMFINKKPLFVSSFGSNIHFTNDKNNITKCSLCEKYDKCRYVDKSNNEFSGINYDLCPYTVKSDIVDHQVVIIEYENGITASFTVSMHAEKGNRKMSIYGTNGVIRTDFSLQEITVDYTNNKQREVFDIKVSSNGHGGGDENLCKLFIGNKDKNEIYNGILSTAIALAAEKSRNEKVVVSMKDFISFIF